MRPALFLLLPLLASASALATPGTACTAELFRAAESRWPTDDGQGHGPDPGSIEWRAAVEFRLGVRGDPAVPARDGEAWCTWLERRLETARQPATTGAPAFDCRRAEGRVEQRICGDAGLAALDRRLDATYHAAQAKATDERPPTLAASQRGWIKGRNDCWKADDLDRCIADHYIERIAELQARYRLAPMTGPVFYHCDDAPHSEIVVSYFDTDPPTLVAERGDSVSLMLRRPTGSGARYQGRNESFWAHQGEATVRWGHGAGDMHCVASP